MAKKEIKKEEVAPPPVKKVTNTGKGVAIYKDKEANRFVLCLIEVSNGGATVTSTEVLRMSKMGTIMKAKLVLEQLLEKELKESNK